MNIPKGKKLAGKIKLMLPAGKATPAPPVGPALGQKGLNLMGFCQDFNNASKSYAPGTILNVKILAFTDKTYVYTIEGRPTTQIIKDVLKLSKGSSAPGRTSAGTITQEQIEVIAQEKMKEVISARTKEAAIKIVEGCAKSMGLKKEVKNG